MLQTFTEDSLLQMLKQRMGIYTSACGAEIVTQQSADIDTMLRLKLKARYLQLLHTAEPSLLPTQDASMQASTFSSASDGIGKIELPESIIRATEVKLPEWPTAVSDFVEHGTPEAEQIRCNPYSRSTIRPKVIRQGQTLWLYSTNTSGRLILDKLTVVTKPAINNYTLDIRLLDSLLEP